MVADSVFLVPGRGRDNLGIGVVQVSWIIGWDVARVRCDSVSDRRRPRSPGEHGRYASIASR